MVSSLPRPLWPSTWTTARSSGVSSIGMCHRSFGRQTPDHPPLSCQGTTAPRPNSRRTMCVHHNAPHAPRWPVFCADHPLVTFFCHYLPRRWRHSRYTRTTCADAPTKGAAAGLSRIGSGRTCEGAGTERVAVWSSGRGWLLYSQTALCGRGFGFCCSSRKGFMVEAYSNTFSDEEQTPGPDII